MNEKKVNNKKLQWQDILKYAMIAASIAFISFLFPGESHFNYKYQKGSNWAYDDLVAPFSFAIKRSAEEVELETEHVRKEFVPIYVKDDKVQDKFNLMIDNVDMNFLENPIAVKDFLKNQAAIQFRKGILSLQDYNEIWQKGKE